MTTTITPSRRAHRGDRIRISHHRGKKTERLTLRVLWRSGAGIIGIATSGEIYDTAWEEAKGDTPGQRGQHHFRPQERHWRCYADGLYRYQHGIMHALMGGDQRLPQIAELQLLCRQVNVEIQPADKISLAELIAIQENVDRLYGAIANGSSPELLEAAEQLTCCVLVRDNQAVNGFQLCVVKARLHAVDRRFLERLQNILGWQPQYLARFAVAQQGCRQAKELLKRTVHCLQSVRDTLHYDQRRERPRSIDALKELLADIKRWGLIKPFVAWSEHMVNDLSELITRMQHPYNSNDERIIKEKLHILIQASQFKLLQGPLENTIWLLSRSLEFASVLPNQTLERHLGWLRREAGPINDSQWQQPMVKPFLAQIAKANEALRHDDRKSMLEKLKEASRLM